MAEQKARKNDSQSAIYRKRTVQNRGSEKRQTHRQKTKPEREKDKQTRKPGRKTDRQSSIWRDRHTDRQIYMA